MTGEPFPGVFVNNIPTTPIEVEGSPRISIDPITNALVIRRLYAIYRPSYNPAMLVQGQKDYQYNAFYSHEEETETANAITRFTRYFYGLPLTRTEPRLVAFTYPGESSIQFSAATGAPIGWNSHGAASPFTQQLLATVAFSYVNRPSPQVPVNTLFSIPPITQILYQGNPVDYTGFVYASVGTVSIGNGKTETRFQLQGATNPLNPPSAWTLSTAIRRWQGPIWEMEVVTIPDIYDV